MLSAPAARAPSTPLRRASCTDAGALCGPLMPRAALLLKAQAISSWASGLMEEKAARATACSDEDERSVPTAAVA
jgi:hypothetical protein